MEKKRSTLVTTEDWWAVWLGLGIMLAAIIFYTAGGTLKPLAVSPPKWVTWDKVSAHFAENIHWYLLQMVVWLFLFSVTTRIMGLKQSHYIPGFIILFLLSTIILILGNWKTFSDLSLEPPILALLLGLFVSNILKVPQWFKTSLRTEYYIKTGIVLLGATLPLTLIIYAGPTAFSQATIISLVTFGVIYFVGTRAFKLDQRFASVLGVGGSVCGVSAAIATGAAVKAEKEHVSITICIVTLWALVMIFFLTFACKALNLPEGVAGAWIGSSEFADAAGYAAAASIGEAAVNSFTVVKVIGRDVWIGIWAFILSFISVTVWEKTSKKDGAVQMVGALIIWERFPKFVIGFILASLIMSAVSTQFTVEKFNQVLTPLVINPIKTLRTWTFTFTFLSIGLTTRFKEIFQFGWKPLTAFSAGAMVNVLLGYFLSNIVFKAHWIAF